MMIRLIALNKWPGLRPLGVLDVVRRLLEKYVLQMVGKDSTHTCNKDQLCGGLMAGIYGGIHTMCLMWRQHSLKEQFGFLLVYAHNIFSKLNHTAMLWVEMHLWTSAARINLNLYQHHIQLITRSTNGISETVLRKEGVKKGELLVMMVYMLGVIHLVKKLQG